MDTRATCAETRFALLPGHEDPELRDDTTLRKRRDSGDGAAKDQRMDVVGAFISIDGFKVGGVAHHVIFDLNSVGAVHIARHPRDIERLAAIVAFDDGDHLRRHLALVHQTADAQAALKPERDVGLHIRELLLHQLRSRQRTAELLSLEHVFSPRSIQSSAAPIAPHDMP